MNGELARDILSDINVYTKYARYDREKERRETWTELVNRNKNMHLKKYPYMKDDIEWAYQYVYNKKLLPSMRSLQFAGKAIELNPARIYNCSYLPVDSPIAFSEIMFLLLSGVGVGYSVQQHHIEALPYIRIPNKKRRYLIGDSIEGWSDAIKALCKAYFEGKPLPLFDFGDIRLKGAELITSGGRAPGPEPLKECLFQIKKVLDRKKDGEQLRSIEVHDIVCYIADAVLAGGIRRSACIALFTIDDEDMLTCKYGNWYEINPQRARANNSAVCLRSRLREKKFRELFRRIRESQSGEPGIYITNDPEYGTNPCVETSLRRFTFCNLVEVNGNIIYTQFEFNDVCRAAAIINTLQAGYTDFHYLREIWKCNTERDALIGIGITGIASGTLDKINLTEAAELILSENERIAKLIGINPAARTTLVKPSGNSSCVLGTSSGIHAWHAEYYFRRIRIGKNEAIYNYLVHAVPQLLEDDFLAPTTQAVLTIPQMAPENAALRSESILQLLERVKRFNLEWTRAGHRSGPNFHNVSTTINVRESEWEDLAAWMWKNRDNFHGMAIFPYYGGTHAQLPFEEISEEVYLDTAKKLKKIDLTKVKEEQDYTNISQEVACAGGQCDLIM